MTSEGETCTSTSSSEVEAETDAFGGRMAVLRTPEGVSVVTADTGAGALFTSVVAVLLFDLCSAAIAIDAAGPAVPLSLAICKESARGAGRRTLTASPLVRREKSGPFLTPRASAAAGKNLPREGTVANM